MLEDYRGLQCPLPLLKTKQAIKRLLQSDDEPKQLSVLVDDAGSAQDIPAFLAEHKPTPGSQCQIEQCDAEKTYWRIEVIL